MPGARPVVLRAVKREAPEPSRSTIIQLSDDEGSSLKAAKREPEDSEAESNTSDSLDEPRRVPRRKARPSKSTRILCRLCDTHVLRKAAFIRIHLLKAHIGKTGIGCRFCAFTEDWTPKNVGSHMLVQHPDEEPDDFLDQRDELADEIRQEAKRCFPEFQGFQNDEQKAKRPVGGRRIRRECPLCGEKFTADRACRGAGYKTREERVAHVIAKIHLFPSEPCPNPAPSHLLSLSSSPLLPNPSSSPCPLQHRSALKPALQCGLCAFRAPWTRGEMEAHFGEAHAGQAVAFDDQRDATRDDTLERFIFAQ